MNNAPEPAWTDEPPYRSPRCMVGQHPRCRDAEPRESGVPGVRVLVCTCPCHRP